MTQPVAPAFSVIMPGYRSAAWIGDAIRSVLNQTRPDWELLVVDNGSPESLEPQVEPFLSDPRIRFVRFATNRMPGIVRHEALPSMRGRYLVMLDSDDELLPNHFELTGRILDERPDVGLVACNARIRDDATGEIRAKTLAQHRRWRAPRHLRGHEVFRDLIARNFIQAASTIRRSTYEAVGGLDVDIKGPVDWDLWLRIAASGAAIEYLREPLMVYRIHANSLARPDDDLKARDVNLDLAHIFEKILKRSELSLAERRVASRNLSRHLRNAHMAEARAALLAGDKRGARRSARLALRLWHDAKTIVVAGAILVAPGVMGRLHHQRLERARRQGRPLSD